MKSPALIAHCDWGKYSYKRWMAVAVQEGGRFSIAAPELVGQSANLFEKLAGRTLESGSVLVGFDFPIGVPKKYGEKTGLLGFQDLLHNLGSGVWNDWYDVCRHPPQISVHRPFYPYGTKGVKQEHLVSGLGVDSINDLRRTCELPTAKRKAGCSLFWTLGPDQVGKGAITGWRELVVPALENSSAALWPYDGPLSELMEKERLVIVETYPAEAFGHLGLERKLSKRNPDHRRIHFSKLRRWADRPDVDLAPDLLSRMELGFGDDKTGEDQFDALIGLFGMIDVVTGRLDSSIPNDPDILRWEGWIFGQEPIDGF
jgi:hypothetical protein